MTERTIITIERLTACGGFYIGRSLSQWLQLPCYDREILTGAAQLINQDPGVLSGRDERRATIWEKLLGTFSVGTPETEYSPPTFPFVEDESLFGAEAAVIRQAAARGSGVFIGHGAARVLQGQPGLLRVFCHAPRKFRIERLRELYGYNEKDAASALDSNDRQQREYLKAVDGINWREATAYDLCLNTELTGIDEAVDIILGVLKQRESHGNPAESGGCSAGGVFSAIK
jgi:cytidylate kinase